MRVPLPWTNRGCDEESHFVPRRDPPCLSILLLLLFLLVASFFDVSVRVVSVRFL